MSMASPIDLPLVGSASSSLSAAETKLPFLRQQLHSAVSSPGSVMVESVDEVEGLYVAVERCPLCTTSRRRLTCARCIQAGDFVFFDGRNSERCRNIDVTQCRWRAGSKCSLFTSVEPASKCLKSESCMVVPTILIERYSEKWGRLQKLEEEKERLQQSVLRVMGRRIQADEMKWKIMLFKKKRDQLKEAVAWGNEEVKSYRELLLRSQEETQRLQRRAGRHQEKRDKIDRHNRRLVELLERRSREQHNKLSQLAALRRDHIQELITHIFHMQEEKQSSRDLSDVTEVDLALTSSTVTELAEARRTTYLSGRWIWDDQNGETSISITGTPVVLPSNGDCSAYYSWVEEKSTSSGPELDHINPAHTISAALCYATQLVTILSHILDVNLPKRLCNSEFCGENLNRHRFTRSLNKLNTNILHLCFSQHVNSEKLHPHHTLRNIMFLVSLDNINLGRTGSFEVSSDLEDSIEFVEPEASGLTEESGDESVTDEETDLGTDWETVPSPRFCDIPSQSMDLSQSTLQVSQPSANPGGMISSAAASVTSWFRAYTGQR